MDNKQYTNVKFQDAVPFYRDMYALKLECIRSCEFADPEQVLKVVDYYKKIKNIYKYVYAYVSEKDKEEKYKKKLKEIKETLGNELKEYFNNEKINNVDGRKKQKERMRILIDELEDIELFIYVCIKTANLEVPLTKNNPYNAMMQSEMF